jgi:nicotinate-nucleotide--dimethylbenzimidazole phosphoribosyltransferase
MAETAGVDLFPIDIGMVTDVPSVTDPEEKVMYGTKNMAMEPAMSREQAAQAVLIGIRKVKELAEQGYDLIATGEMGIGNTTTSSAVVSVLLDESVENVTGRGAGLSSEGLNRKIRAIERAIEKHQPDKKDILDVLSKVGGLDIAGMTGAFLGGAIYHIPVLIDGFISSAAALCAVRMVPETADYILASHCSGEPAGRMVLEELKLPYLIDAKMSLGEGSGAVAAIPLLEMGVNVYRKMSTFEEIKVEQYEELK